MMQYRQWLKQVLMLAALTVSATSVAGAGLVAVPDHPQAEDFTLPAANGSRHKLSDYRGSYVLVNFWAAWCSPCIRELPSMQRTYTAFQDRGLEIIAIHAGPETAEMQALLERFAISFPVLVDANLALSNWNVSGLPTSFLLDPEGRVIYRAAGAIDWDEPVQRNLLEQLLDEKISAVDNRTPSVATM